MTTTELSRSPAPRTHKPEGGAPPIGATSGPDAGGGPAVPPAGRPDTIIRGHHKSSTFVKIILAIVITTVVVGTLGTIMGWKMGSPAAEVATAVRPEPVSRGLLVERVSAPGIIQPKTKVNISAKISARIEELPFEEGDAVKVGDPLVKLDARDLEAQLRAVEARRSAQEAQITVAEARIEAQAATIEAQKAVLAEAELDLRRQTELLASKDVSQAVVDAAKAEVDRLAAQLESARRTLQADRANLVVMRHELDAAEAEIMRARDALSYTTIASPLDGVVTRLNAKVGELVVTGTMNNAGTVIMEVADLGTMLVETKVDESDIALIQPGQPADVRTMAYGDEVFAGKVDNIALAHSEDVDRSKYYETEILIKTDGRRIYSGLTADVDIETKRHENVVRVPSQAVVGRAVDELPQDVRGNPEVDQRKAFTTVVYRMINGKAVATPVKVGPSDITHTCIESGLKEGELIVVGPYKVLESLKHDQLIKDEAETPKASDAK